MDLSPERVERLALAWRDQLGQRDRHAEALLGQLAAIMRKRMSSAIQAFALSDSDDVDQAIGIALVKAINTYDPAKSRFVTHATWAIRAGLSELNWQLYPDRRAHNRARGFQTVGMTSGAGDDEIDLLDQHQDHEAEARTEASVSDHLAALILERHLRAARAARLAAQRPTAALAKELDRLEALTRAWLFDEAVGFRALAAEQGLSLPAARRRVEAHLALAAPEPVRQAA